jgi:hypothetical protein
MREVRDFWTPQGMHGELDVPDGADIEQLIKRAVRKFNRTYEDIQYCIKKREDGSKLVYFELME